MVTVNIGEDNGAVAAKKPLSKSASDNTEEFLRDCHTYIQLLFYCIKCGLLKSRMATVKLAVLSTKPMPPNS